MSNIFNQDFQDFLMAFNNNDVDYILLGGYAVILHGYARTTGDMDLYVRRNAENYQKIVKAFQEFGMPVFDMTLDNFLNNNNIDVFTFGVPPVSIDIMTSAKELEFEESFSKATLQKIDDLEVRVVHIDDLIRQKKSVNRPKDINDIQHLRSLEEE